jgi:hypothetical protein
MSRNLSSVWGKTSEKCDEIFIGDSNLQDANLMVETASKRGLRIFFAVNKIHLKNQNHERAKLPAAETIKSTILIQNMTTLR